MPEHANGGFFSHPKNNNINITKTKNTPPEKYIDSAG